MNKFIFVFALLALSTCEPAHATISEPDFAALSNFKNYAVNGGAEQNKAGWAVSGTSSALSNLAIDTTNKYEGNAGFAWTPANANNILSNAALSLSANQGLSGHNCAARVYVKTSSALKTLEAYDGSNVMASQLIPASTNFQPVTLNWICSATGSNRVRFGAGDTTAIYFDSLKWGDAQGINLFAATGLAGTASAAYTPTFVGFGTPTAIDFKWRQVGEFYEVQGQFTGGTMSNATYSISLPNGELTDPTVSPGDVLGMVTVDQNLGGEDIYICGNPSTAGVNFCVQPAASAYTLVTTTGPMPSAGAVYFVQFKVRIKGKVAQVNGLNYLTNAPSGPTIQKFLSGSGTYTPPTNPRPSYIRVRMVGGGGGGSGANNSGHGASGTDTTFGTSLLSAGGGSGGGDLGDAPATGGASSLGTGPIGLALHGAGAGSGGPDNATGATLAWAGGNGGSSAFGGAGSGGEINVGAGHPGEANTGGGGGGGASNYVATTWGGLGGGAGGFVDALITPVQNSYAYVVGAGGSGGGSSGAGAAGGSGLIEVTEYYGNGQVPAYVGSVTSRDSGQRRTESVSFGGDSGLTSVCSSSPCVAAPGGSSDITSITRTGTGAYTVTFSTPWTSIPSCPCSGDNVGSLSCVVDYSNSTTTAVKFKNYNQVPSAVDNINHIVCMGPR